MKVAIATGAAQGIGPRTAEVLAEAGYALALLDLKRCAVTLTNARPYPDARRRVGRTRRARECRVPRLGKDGNDAADQAGGGYNDADIQGVNPMGRFAAPDDIARAILFLADHKQSGFITGHAQVVEGGWTADGSWQSLRMRKR